MGVVHLQSPMKMTKTKIIVPTMVDNIWRILETTGVNTRSFSLNIKLENCYY